jgi:hypothetical protein
MCRCLQIYFVFYSCISVNASIYTKLPQYDHCDCAINRRRIRCKLDKVGSVEIDAKVVHKVLQLPKM